MCQKQWYTARTTEMMISAGAVCFSKSHLKLNMQLNSNIASARTSKLPLQKAILMLWSIEIVSRCIHSIHMWDFRHQNGGVDRLLWMLEYHITAHTELHMTCRKMFTDYCMARAITASSCFWQFDGNWLKWISKFLEQSFRCRCLPHARQGCNKNKELLLSSAFIFHRRLHFRCVKQMFCLRLSAVFAELWNQPASHNTAHKSFLIYSPLPAPPQKKRQLASLP